MLKKDSKSSGNQETGSGPLRYKKVLYAPESKQKAELGFKSQKIAESKSIERQRGIKIGENPQNQKTEVMQTSRSSKQEQTREQKGGNLSRSKSREQKDRLSMNLAKFTRRGPNEKSKISSKEEKPTESVYVDREESIPTPTSSQKVIQNSSKKSEQSPYQIQMQQPKVVQPRQVQARQVRQVQQETNFPSKKSMFSQQFDSIISEDAPPAKRQEPSYNYDRNQQYQNRLQPQSQPQSQPQPKPQPQTQVQTQQYQQRASSRNQQDIRQMSNQRSSAYGNSSSSKQIATSSRVDQRSIGKLDASKRSGNLGPSTSDINKIQSAAATNLAMELEKKMNKHTQESERMIARISQEKRQLQRTNEELIQSQFKIRNQLEFLKITNIQLEKELQYQRSLNTEEEKNKQKDMNGIVYQLRETQNQLEMKKNDYWQKVEENNKLIMTIKELEVQCQQYENKNDSFESAKISFQKKLQRQAKYNQVRIEQLKSSYEFKLKQMQLQNNNKNSSEYREQIKEKDREISILKNELRAKEQKIMTMLNDQVSTEKQQMQYHLDAMQTENATLLEQLNYTQEKIRELTQKLNQEVKNSQIQIKKRQQIIKSLNDQLQHIQRSKKSEGLDKKAYTQMYQNGSVESTSFIQLQQTQTQVTNALRDQIAQRTKQLFIVQNENEQLKHKIRQMQQENQMSNRTSNANLNNMKQYKQHAEIVMKSEVQSLKRQIGVLQTRLEMKDREVRDRNRFIQESLSRGVSKHEQAANLILKLERALEQTSV